MFNRAYSRSLGMLTLLLMTPACWKVDNEVGTIVHDDGGSTGGAPGIDAANLASGTGGAATPIGTGGKTTPTGTGGAVGSGGTTMTTPDAALDAAPDVAPDTAPATITLKSISAQVGTACGVRADHSTICWGSSQKPRRIGFYKSVAVGATWSSGLRMDGSGVCFDNDGALISTPAAGKIDGGFSAVSFELPPYGPFASISTGGNRSCGVKTDGTLACWGVPVSTEVLPQGLFTSISVGGSFACAVRSDGTVACWNQVGGNSVFPPMDGGAPAALPDGYVTSFSSGVDFACGVRPDGTLACWGRNTSGDIFPPSGTFTAVSAGLAFACGIKTDGTLACWGDNSMGQATPPAGTFTALATGSQFGCAIRTDGTVACWGDNSMGQATPPTPAEITGLAGPYLTASPSTARFSACIGEPGDPIAVTIENLGATAVGPLTTLITGDAVGEFIITASDCDVIASGASCTMVVNVKPSDVADTRLATLQLIDPSGSPAVSVALNALNYTDAPLALATPTALDFGTVPVGGTGAPLTLTLSNGAACAANTDRSFRALVSSPDFVVVNDTCSSGSIPSGGSCALAISFVPTRSGSRTATMTLSTASGFVVVSLAGTATTP